MAGSELPAITGPVPRTRRSKMSTPTSCVRHLQALLRSHQHQVVPIVERYCDRFGLKRLRDSDDRVPPREVQETLAELVRHYEELGLRRMREEVFRGNYCSPGTRVRKSDNVFHCAQALRGVRIETLQDVAEQPATKIKGALRRIRGIGERTVHMLLMYCGDDEFVMSMFAGSCAERSARRRSSRRRRSGSLPTLPARWACRLGYSTCGSGSTALTLRLEADESPVSPGTRLRRSPVSASPCHA